MTQSPPSDQTKPPRGDLVSRTRIAVINGKDRGQRIVRAADDYKYQTYLKLERWRWFIMPSFILGCLIYSLILQVIGVQYAFAVAMIGLGNGLVQEIAHARAMKVLGYPTHNLTIFGINFREAHDKAKFALAPPFDLARIHLAGPGINFCIMVSALIAERVPGTPNQQSWSMWQFGKTPSLEVLLNIVIATSASITVMSLLPIPMFDGGKLLRLLFNSTSDTLDRLVAASCSLLSISFTGWMLLTDRFSSHAIVLAVGVLWVFTVHDKGGHISSNAIPLKSGMRLGLAWLGMLITSIIVMVSVPPAINAHHLRHGLQLTEQHFWHTAIIAYHGWVVGVFLALIFWRTSLRLLRYGFTLIWRSVLG